MRDRKDPCLNIVGQRIGDQQRYMRANWRDHRNISSFYFTRFSEDTTEEELWQHFKKAGNVREIFISKKRNRNGRRYGFVRFIGVDNVQQLERRLDNIVLGGLKLYVNNPKYERSKGGAQQSATGGRQYTSRDDQGHRDTYEAATHTSISGLRRGSFAEVVARRHPRTTIVTLSAAVGNTSTSEVTLDIPRPRPKWLQDDWVGRLKNIATLDRVQEDMLWDWGVNIVPKYIGDDMVLLLSLTEGKARQMMENNTSLFYSVERWNREVCAGSRLTWLHCWGVPLMA